MNRKLRKLTVCAVFAAISTVLMFLKLPLPFLPPYLTLDFGDLPALIGAFSLGPVWGVLICLVKNLICLIETTTGGVGELANFLNGASFVFVAGIIYKYRKTKKGAVIGAFAGTLTMCIVGFIVNILITYPFYFSIMSKDAVIGMYTMLCPWANTLIKGLLVFNLPFSFVRGILLSVITMLVYKRLSPIIKGK